MSEIIKNRVIQLFNEVNDNPELFVVDVQIEMNAEEKKISLLLDGDKGVSIKNCVEVSRKMNLLLDEDTVLGDAFTWEVSSPGTDLSLKDIRQFPKHIGRNLAVTDKDGNIFEGKLVAVEGTQLFFEAEEMPKQAENAPPKKNLKPIKVEKNITFEQIKSAFVLISFK
jgi:ribosome maturation factor RimP